MSLTLLSIVAITVIPDLTLSVSHPTIAFVHQRHPHCFKSERRRPPSVHFESPSPLNGETSSNEEFVDDVMSKNQLMHFMIRVADVNATIDFWKEQGASVHSYRRTAKAETAFVGFGASAPDGGGPKDDGYLSIEITATSPSSQSFVVGNCISYFGLSMFRKPGGGGDAFLRAVAAGETTLASQEDPNGFQVRSVAAAPGDPFARLCFKAIAEDGNLERTAQFYQMLGMKVVAEDESLVCLRYPVTRDELAGVATTLVFESDSESGLDMGDCYDHLAISTPNLEKASAKLQSEDQSAIFMNPTPMFGTQIMGVQDPNGYKVYLVQEQ